MTIDPGPQTCRAPCNVNFEAQHVKLVFTKILNVVQLFTNPTVVTVQPTLSCVRGLRDRGARTFLAAQTIFTRFQAIFERF